MTDSPVVVVTSQFGYSAQQEKIRKAQAFQNKAQMGMMAVRKTLEVNLHHPFIVDLLAKIANDKEDAALLDTAQVLFQTALLESGYKCRSMTHINQTTMSQSLYQHPPKHRFIQSLIVTSQTPGATQRTSRRRQSRHGR